MLAFLVIFVTIWHHCDIVRHHVHLYFQGHTFSCYAVAINKFLMTMDVPQQIFLSLHRCTTVAVVIIYSILHQLDAIQI